MSTIFVSRTQLQVRGKHIDQTELLRLTTMETIDDVDNMSKNIVREICRECKAKHVIIDENFCIFYIKLLMLDPVWGITPDSTLEREKIANFVNHSVENLLQANNSSIITLKSQFYFTTMTANKEATILLQRLELVEKVKTLKNDILNFYLRCDKSHEQKLLKKIIIYITLMSGMGNPLDNHVMREVTIATQSVFDVNDLRKFAQMSIREKEQQINILQDLVMGVRLFSLKCGKIHSDFTDLTIVLKQACELIVEDLQKTLCRIMEKVNIITTVITCSYEFLTDFANDDGPHTIPLTNINCDADKDVLDLIAYRQYEIFIRKLLLEISENTEKNTTVCDKKLKSVLGNLINITKFRVAIPATQVYPLFTELAEIGYQIQDEVIMLTKFEQLSVNIHQLMLKIEFPISKYMKIINHHPIMTDATRLQTTMGQKIKQSTVQKCKVHYVKKLERVNLEYHGFCPFYLAETSGGLVPGNPNMGLLEYDNKYYAFSSLPAAIYFGMKPTNYILKILETCREKPSLIHFMNVLSDLKDIQKYSDFCEKPVKVVMVKHATLQTDLHPIRYNIDKSYRWNVWDIYREAIKMANISQCATHSTQTDKSHYRVPVRTQTTEMKEKNVQTKKDNYTNVPTLSNFIFGLYGRKDEQQHIIELTRPVDE